MTRTKTKTIGTHESSLALFEQGMFQIIAVILIFEYPHVVEVMLLTAVLSLSGMVRSSPLLKNTLEEQSILWRIFKYVCICITFPIAVYIFPIVRQAVLKIVELVAVTLSDIFASLLLDHLPLIVAAPLVFISRYLFVAATFGAIAGIWLHLGLRFNVFLTTLIISPKRVAKQIAPVWLARQFRESVIFRNSYFPGYRTSINNIPYKKGDFYFNTVKWGMKCSMWISSLMMKSIFKISMPFGALIVYSAIPFILNFKTLDSVAKSHKNSRINTVLACISVFSLIAFVGKILLVINLHEFCDYWWGVPSNLLLRIVYPQGITLWQLAAVLSPCFALITIYIYDKYALRSSRDQFVTVLRIANFMSRLNIGLSAYTTFCLIVLAFPYTRELDLLASIIDVPLIDMKYRCD